MFLQLPIFFLLLWRESMLCFQPTISHVGLLFGPIGVVVGDNARACTRCLHLLILMMARMVVLGQLLPSFLPFLFYSFIWEKEEERNGGWAASSSSCCCKRNFLLKPQRIAGQLTFPRTILSYLHCFLTATLFTSMKFASVAHLGTLLILQNSIRKKNTFLK